MPWLEEQMEYMVSRGWCHDRNTSIFRRGDLKAVVGGGSVGIYHGDECLGVSNTVEHAMQTARCYIRSKIESAVSLLGDLED